MKQLIIIYQGKAKYFNLNNMIVKKENKNGRNN